MNISQIKAEISAIVNHPIVNLQMCVQEDTLGSPTEWLAHWDNNNRVKIVMHKEVFEKASDPSFNGLALKQKLVTPANNKEPYHKFVVVTPKNIMGVL